MLATHNPKNNEKRSKEEKEEEEGKSPGTCPDFFVGHASVRTF